MSGEKLTAISAGRLPTVTPALEVALPSENWSVARPGDLPKNDPLAMSTVTTSGLETLTRQRRVTSVSVPLDEMAVKMKRCDAPEFGSTTL
jgi:hypothetical protein